MNNIKLNEFESLFELIIKKLKNDKLNDFEFNTDNYWIITSDEWSEFNKTPEPVVGSLFEDIEYLKKTIEAKEIYTYSDFDRLATLLRAVSQMQAPI